MAANSETALLEFLHVQEIPFTRFEHPPVFTCAEAKAFRLELPGLETKNLFLRDERRNFYLVMTICAKRIDLKALARSIDAPKLQFGTSEQLFAHLGLTPGAVTILGLINDANRTVNLIVDQAYWPSQFYLCHPLVNTATLVLDHQALLKFLDVSGHSPRVIAIPALVD